MKKRRRHKQIIRQHNSYMSNIAVLGAGSWGTALALLVANNGHQTLLWGRNVERMQEMAKQSCNPYFLPGIPFPKNLIPSSNLKKVLAQADDILVVVPSHAFRQLLEKVHRYQPHLKKISWASKGLEQITYNLLHKVVFDIFGQQTTVAIISGPTFANEVALGYPTAVTIASKNDNYSQHLAKILRSKTFRPYTSKDMIAIEIAGACKNVLAIAAGIADGLGFGANTRSALITRGLAEICRISEALGGHKETLMGLAGLGDLLLTCTDNQSRNRRMGLALAKGFSVEQAQQEIQQVVEGVANAQAIYHLAQNINVEIPIIEQVYQVLYQQQTPEDAVTALLSREQKSE